MEPLGWGKDEGKAGKDEGRSGGVAQPPTVREAPSLQDQQFEEQLRIAEHLVRALREAGYSRGLAEDVHALTCPLQTEPRVDLALPI